MSTTTPAPIKRHEALQTLSRDHHHGLLLCWKIRTGFKKGIDTKRIKDYCNWFFEEHLLEHFESEEKFIFPLLESDNELVKKAIADHRRLSRLFHQKDEIEKTLSLIEEELENHIRFEERILFNEIQKASTSSDLKRIKELHEHNIHLDNWNDKFWE